jgi:DNA invertase Pin-like site-specific DNA recombinase
LEFRTGLIGYARVSTQEQDPRLQIDALQEAGCTKIFTDEGVSGAAVIKPKLIEALAYARSGDDTLVVWKLDRLSRSTRDLIETVEGMKARGIGLRSIKESVIDTTSAAGNLIFQIFGAFAEFERGTNHERTMAGIAAAQRAGKWFGRPPSISDAQWSKAKDLLRADPPSTGAAIATLIGVSRQAIYRRLERERVTLS